MLRHSQAEQMSCRKLKCGAYILVCSLHTVLTLGVFSTLFLKHTEIQDSFVLNKDLGYGIAFVCLLGLSLLMYYIACFIDPGFVPVNRKSVSALDSEDDEEQARENSTMLPTVKLRRCGFCGIEQPLRARHCEDCDRCVRKFDHHCPWLGNCVGENNHKFFWLFLMSKSAVILWGAVILWRAFEEHPTWPEWFYHNLLFVLDFVVLVPAGITVIALFFTHTYCMMANITSWEFVSREKITYLKNFDEDLNPFHEGYLGNTFYFLCGCRTRSWEKVYDRFRRLRGSNNV